MVTHSSTKEAVAEESGGFTVGPIPVSRFEDISLETRKKEGICEKLKKLFRGQTERMWPWKSTIAALTLPLEMRKS